MSADRALIQMFCVSMFTPRYSNAIDVRIAEIKYIASKEVQVQSIQYVPESKNITKDKKNTKMAFKNTTHNSLTYISNTVTFFTIIHTSN